MELAHDQILQATPDELLSRPEYLGPNKPGHIVDVEPWRGFAACLKLRFGYLHLEGTRQPVLARFMDHHVVPMTVAVGEIRPLPGFEIEAVFAGPGVRILDHLLQADVESRIRRVAPGNALEPDARAAGLRPLHLRLHVDVSEHGMRQDILQPECLNEILQSALNGFNRTGIA